MISLIAERKPFIVDVIYIGDVWPCTVGVLVRWFMAGLKLIRIINYGTVDTFSRCCTAA